MPYIYIAQSTLTIFNADTVAPSGFLYLYGRSNAIRTISTSSNNIDSDWDYWLYIDGNDGNKIKKQPKYSKVILNEPNDTTCKYLSYRNTTHNRIACKEVTASATTIPKGLWKWVNDGEATLYNPNSSYGEQTIQWYYRENGVEYPVSGYFVGSMYYGGYWSDGTAFYMTNKCFQSDYQIKGSSDYYFQEEKTDVQHYTIYTFSQLSYSDLVSSAGTKKFIKKEQS